MPAKGGGGGPAPKRKIKRVKHSPPKTFKTEAAQGGHERKAAKPRKLFKGPKPKVRSSEIASPVRGEKHVEGGNRNYLAERRISKELRPKTPAQKFFENPDYDTLTREQLLERRAALHTKKDRERLKQIARLEPGTEVKVKRLKFHGGASPAADLVSPALKTLEQTTRPVHGIAAGTKAAVQGKGSKKAAKAFLKGVKNEDKSTFSDVLKEAGVKNKAVRGIVGTALDIGLDPTTYTTFGAGTPVKLAARKAGTKTYKQARKAGASVKDAEKLAAKAEKSAAAKHPDNKGITVSFAGRSTTGKTSAKVMKRVGASKAATKVRESAPVQALGKDLRPDFRPKEVPEKEFTTVRHAARESRQHAMRGREKAIDTGLAVKKRIPKEDLPRVVEAIERGTVYDLPEHLRVPAREVELAFRKARKAERKAGIEVPNRRNYFTHALDEGLGKKGKPGKGGGRRTIKPEYAQGRKYQGRVSQIAEREGVEFSTNVPVVLADRLAKSSRDVAQARFNKSLASAGREVKYGEKVELADGEQLYKIVGTDVKPLGKWEKEHVQAGTKKPPKATAKHQPKYVVLNEKFVDDQLSAIVPGSTRSSVGRVYDKAQGGFKFVATVPNPGFHSRNLIGDTQNAYLAENVPALGRNLGQSARALRRLNKQEDAAREIGKRLDPQDAGVTVKSRYGEKQKLTYDALVREAEQAGAIRAGFISRELPELLRDVDKGVKGGGRLRKTKRLIQNREDVVRLATYIGGRKRGLSPREATDRAMKHHFDYGDLTDFERTFMRRVFPFYTFTARNLPLQIGSLVRKPGKFANVEKVREETAKAMGFREDWQQDLEEYKQRGVPLPISWKGHKFAASPALPLTDLNQFTLNPGEQVKKAISMVNPVVKSPVELYANYHFFFRGQIERDESPLVAAPSYVAAWPEAVKKKFGVVPDYTDRRTGDKGWGWPAKVDYVARAVPGPPNVVQHLLTPLKNRRGQDTEAKLISYLAGVKFDDYDPTSAALIRGFDAREKLEKKLGALRQRGIGSKKSGLRETPEYRKLREEVNGLTEVISRLSQQRGDKRPYGKPGRKKLKQTPEAEFQQFLKDSQSSAKTPAQEFEEFLQGR